MVNIIVKIFMFNSQLVIIHFAVGITCNIDKNAGF